MELNNAFDVLGANPTDNAEKLQEYLEEKELLLDDMSTVQAAYVTLTNPKKRLIQEIFALRVDDFSDIKKLIFRKFDSAPSTLDVALILVNLGIWFDCDNDELLNDINQERKESGFPTIDDALLIQAIDEIRVDYLQSVCAYLDRLKESSLVGIFNKIVEIEEYESLFMDDLMAHYEMLIKDALNQKEQECYASFSVIEAVCDSFNKGSLLPYSLKDKISSFEDTLTSWDRYAQPLQANMQRHGGQHEESSRLLHDLRNRVINLCNESQEALNKLVIELHNLNNIFSFLRSPSASAAQQIRGISQEDFAKSINLRRTLDTKIPDSLRLTKGLISIIDTFLSVFSELDADCELLRKDKASLIDLQNTLSELNAPIQAERRKQGASVNAKNDIDSYFNKTRALQCSKDTSYQTQYVNNHTEKSKQKRPFFFDWSAGRIACGVIGIVCLIIMIICFACGGIIGGTIFTVMTAAFFVCCAFYPHFTNKIIKWIIIGGLILALIIATIVGVTTGYGEPSNSSSVSTNNSSSTKSYIITFNKDGGSGGTSSVSVKNGQSMPNATAPTKKGYVFGGYYSSRNGQGTKYYGENMSSSRVWDKTANVTLYAYWIKDDNGISLTTSNFKTYFNFTSSCSVSRSSYDSYGTATYNFSISPKSSFRYSGNSNNPSSITVTIGLDFSPISSSYGTPCQYKITVTLYKAAGYSYSGTKTYSVSPLEKYWLDGIYSVDGKIYN